MADVGMEAAVEAAQPGGSGSCACDAIGSSLKDRGVLTGIPQEKIHEVSVSEVDD